MNYKDDFQTHFVWNCQKKIRQSNFQAKNVYFYAAEKFNHYNNFVKNKKSNKKSDFFGEC